MQELNNLKNAYRASKAALAAAQAAEREARSVHHTDAAALSSFLREEMKKRPHAIDREIRIGSEVCKVISISVPVHSPEVVNPVVLRKIKTGAWGKSHHIANQVHWDFNLDSWVEG